MSIGGTLSSALSGLTANARAAAIVSSNIANVMTDGYGRREIVLTSRQVGGVSQGVSVAGVYRHADMALIGDRRVAESTAGYHRIQSQFLQRLEGVLGTPEQEQSLSGRIAAFDTALIEASSRPESEPRLARVADTARALAGQLATVSADIQFARTTADDRIESSVKQLNSALTRVEELNRLIRNNSGNGRETSALMDQRQQLIDSIAAIVPVREIARENGQVALMTIGGAILLDGKASVFEFSPVGVITPGMTLASGALSGLTLNGKPLATSGSDSKIAGGTLAADFLVRDQLGPEAQAQIDAIAREVIDRFAAPGLDSTRAPAASGLFTDAGAAFDPLNEEGLSQRLRLNAEVDPAVGGALWRLRDGLGASAPAAVGNAQLLLDWQAALTDVQAPASATFTTGQRSLAGLATDMVSGIAGNRLNAEGEASYAKARADSLLTMELTGGVDSDQEILSLLLIEQNYAANAKVVQTVDDMIKLLLGM
jgi:flagellar hook-associated protein 1 FlgK